MTSLIVGSVLLLAFANGANDNFKGVATLFGSGTADYRSSLLWATLATFGGSLAAVWMAGTLLVRFSGKGLVPDATASDPHFAAAVAAAAGITVLLATQLGFPISTTHALVGAMVGAGVSYSGEIQQSKLLSTFVVPLLVNPVIAVAVTAAVYPMFRVARLRLGIERRARPISVEHGEPAVESAGAAAANESPEPGHERYSGVLCGVEASTLLDALHFVSAGLVSFARGLNDTPKIAALLLLTSRLGPGGSNLVVGITVAVGGLIAARRIAESMSRRITTMNAGQGFTANLITGVLVISASRWGLPVSTTHVSCGALFGIGLVNRQARWRFILQILLAWITTLPVAAVLGWMLAVFLRR